MGMFHQDDSQYEFNFGYSQGFKDGTEFVVQFNKTELTEDRESLEAPSINNILVTSSNPSIKVWTYEDAPDYFKKLLPEGDNSKSAKTIFFVPKELVEKVLQELIHNYYYFKNHTLPDGSVVCLVDWSSL